MGWKCGDTDWTFAALSVDRDFASGLSGVDLATP
jgi:hypothetical protein